MARRRPGWLCARRDCPEPRNTKAAQLTRLLKKQGIAPKRMIIDKLRSYGAARRQVMLDVEHRSHKGLNNRAENAPVPLRKWERMMQGFRSPGALQRLVSIFSALRKSLRPAPLKTLRSRYIYSPPAGHGGMESRGRGQLTSAPQVSTRLYADNVTSPPSDNVTAPLQQILQVSL